MKRETEDKAERVLSMYSRLKQGKTLYKAQESIVFGVTPRTIQRDIADIQCFLQNQSTLTGEVQEVVFHKSVGGYRLETKIKNQWQTEEILAVCKVLLESRALVKEEMFPIINKLINECNDETDGKIIKELLGNEMYHYIELQHKKKLLEELWIIENAIKEKRNIKICYKKVKNEEVRRKVRPVGIMFSEFYFYMTAFIDDIDKEKQFGNPDDTYPTIYRVDRITDITLTDEKFRIPYAERFEEGEFRQRVQFMYGGRLRKVRFKYRGDSMEAVLDRLPTAEKLKKESDGVWIQAEVFGNGIEMWLRSQGDKVVDISYS